MIKGTNRHAAGLDAMAIIMFVGALLIFGIKAATADDEITRDRCVTEQSGQFTAAIPEPAGGDDGSIYHREPVAFALPFCSPPRILATQQTGDAELAIERISAQAGTAELMVVSLVVDPARLGPGRDVVIAWQGESGNE